MRRRGEQLDANGAFPPHGQTEEIGEMVLFLCSDRASYISGGCYNVDAGHGDMNHITRMGSDLHTLTAEPELLDLALDGADVAPLLMVLVHLTGEEHWPDEVAPHINGPWNFQETVPEALKQTGCARE